MFKRAIHSIMTLGTGNRLPVTQLQMLSAISAMRVMTSRLQQDSERSLHQHCVMLFQRSCCNESKTFAWDWNYTDRSTITHSMGEMSEGDRGSDRSGGLS